MYCPCDIKVRRSTSLSRKQRPDAAPCFAAFYADCEHEVSKVTHGLRLCLVYTLVLRVPKRGKQAAATVAETTPAGELARSISGWVTTKESEPLVFAFDHHYTQRGLSRDLLKGSDRATADLVIAAAEQADCRTYFCQVSRHLVQFADDGSSATPLAVFRVGTTESGTR